MKPFKFRVFDNIKKQFCIQENFYISSYGELYERIMCSDRINHQNNSRYEISYSTGLFDENDKEVFEGDILEFTVFDCLDKDTQYKGVVEFTVGSWIINYDHHSDGPYELFWVCQNDDAIKIIGNRFENPELLENLK